MRNTITFAFVALAGLAVSAQTPSSSTSASSSPQNVTVTGCLAAGPNNTFTLVTAAPNSPAATGTSGASTGSAAGASGAAAGTSTGTSAPAVKTITYLLSPYGNVDLKGNAGHKVQVTGVTTPSATVASQTDRSAAQERPQGTSRTPVVKTTERAQIVAHHLNVASVRTVAAKCDILK